MCCVHCSSDQPSDSTHSRVGRKMNQFCSVCQVYICDNCWEQFHNSPVLDLPPCVSGKYNLAVQTRSNVSRCIPCPDASSPVRVSRPRGNASRPRNTSRPRNISNDRRGQPSSSAMSTLRGSPIRRQLIRRRRQQRVGGNLDETDAAAALQQLSGTKIGKSQLPPGPTKRSRRRR